MIFLDAFCKELAKEINTAPVLVFSLTILLSTAMMVYCATKGKAILFAFWLALWLGSIWSVGPILEAINEAAR